MRDVKREVEMSPTYTSREVELISAYTSIIREKNNVIETLKERCKALEEQLNKAQASAIVYKDLFNEAKRIIGEDTLYRRIYEDIDE